MKKVTVPTNVYSNVESMILTLRGQRIILDTDLAALYGVSTGSLNRAVKRNVARFPIDFMFQITQEEYENLKCQFGISSSWGGRRRSLPYAFTEHGVAMLSSVLNSEKAIQINIDIMRAFSRLRHLLISHKELSQKVDGLEKKFDAQFKVVFEALRRIMEPPSASKRRIGFDIENRVK